MLEVEINVIIKMFQKKKRKMFLVERRGWILILL